MALETYFDFAENDFNYFTQSYRAGIVANMMGAMAQGICEKYMKHIITEYDPVETSQEESKHNKILSTHSLDRLMKYLDKKMELPFGTDAKNAMKIIDGYYFSTRYPGDDSIELDQSDIEQCAIAINLCREEVLNMIKEIEELEESNEEPSVSDDDFEL